MTANRELRPSHGSVVKTPAFDHAALMVELLPLGDELRSLEQTYNTWTIKDWGCLQKKVLGPVFKCGGASWQILLYPEGNGVENVSIYFQLTDDSSKASRSWHVCTQFAIVLWNPASPSKYAHHGSKPQLDMFDYLNLTGKLAAAHRFNVDEPDWGFTRFCPLRKGSVSLEGENSPFSGTDGVNLTAYVRVIEDKTGVLWHSFRNYDSKDQTGMIGLKNLGATDYLSCIIQILYHLALFRKTIYKVPTVLIETVDTVWALQQIFCSLQTRSSTVSPIKLTDSFGWKAMQLFEPQDAQEFLTSMLDSLAERLCTTSSRDAFHSIFTIESRTNYSCIKVPYRWSTIEQTRHIRLNVRNNQTLIDSLNEYTSTELLKSIMTGQEHKKQDVARYLSFDHLPSVLFFYLNRVAYDIEANEVKKLTDHFEYPEEIDMSPFLSDKEAQSKLWDYTLFGVVVHASKQVSGNYHTFLRPKHGGLFYKFEDDRITPATLRQVLDDNFGYLNTESQAAAKILEPYYAIDRFKDKTATMLVYIRKSEADSILSDVSEEDIPERIRPRPPPY